MYTTRILLPNRAADPRWGYLDKYDVNLYLARAFALSVLGALAVLALASSWPRLESPQRRHPEPVVIDIWPTLQGARPVPHPARRRPPLPPRTTVTPPRPVPVEAIVSDATADAATMSADTEATTLGDAAAKARLGDEPRPWPAPEDFIPVEYEPVLMTIPIPVYPELAREAGLEGTVLVHVLVGEDGFVHRSLVAQSVLGLDEAALAAASAAVFRPALQQERPVAVWVVVPIEFRLRD